MSIRNTILLPVVLIFIILPFGPSFGLDNPDAGKGIKAIKSELSKPNNCVNGLNLDKEFSGRKASEQELLEALNRCALFNNSVDKRSRSTGSPKPPTGTKPEDEKCPEGPWMRGTVHFEFDSSKIAGSTNVETIANFATAMNSKVFKSCLFEIEGHTDSIGTEEYNQILSERRADSVFKQLISLSIERDHLKVTGKGEKYPMDGFPPESAENRQVRINIIGSR